MELIASGAMYHWLSTVLIRMVCMLILDNCDVKALVSLNDCVEAIEQGYKDIGSNTGCYMPRLNLNFSGQENDRGNSLKLLASFSGSFNIAGAHLYTGGFQKTNRDSKKIVVLFDGSTGAIVAQINSHYLSWLRTAATSIVATKYLALPHFDCLSVIGSGRQAEGHVVAFAQYFHLKRVYCFSRHEENKLRFCTEMEQKLGIPIIPGRNPREVIEKADVIVTATNSAKPVIEGLWLKPGLHINAIGAHYPDERELDSTAVVNSKFVVDLREQALTECGEILIPIEEGLIGPEHIYADLGELVSGSKLGRTDKNEITVFSSGGTGVDYVSVAALAVERAKQKGVGQVVDWKAF
jgi:alanine dehydrogenase